MAATERVRRNAPYLLLIVAQLAPTLGVLLLVVPRLQWLWLLAFLVAPLLAAVVAPRVWPGASRATAMVSMIPGLVAQLVGGYMVIVMLFVAYCGEDDGHEYLSTSAGLVLLALGPIVAIVVAALGGRRLERVWWVWPLAIIAGYATSMTLIALAEGGPHHCYT
jgi:hypothetical protein